MSCEGCKYLKEVYKHPWNSGKAKGNISELFGYACTMFESLKDGSKGFIFFDKDRIKVGCEMYEPSQQRVIPKVPKEDRAVGK